MIVSRQNRKIKDIRRLLRCKGDRAVLEGPHLLAEAKAAELPLEYLLVTPEFLASPIGGALVAGLSIEVSAVEPRLLEQLGDVDSPRGVLAVVSLPRRGLESIPVRRQGLYLFVDGMQDPGNLGALVRVAEAFATTAVLLAPGSVHPNHPRALRASAGSLLRARLAIEVEAAELAGRLAEASPAWLALTPHGGTPLPDVDVEGTLVLAVGAEGPGLSSRVLSYADSAVTVPTASPVESLNATVAVAITLYEIRSRGSVRLNRP